MRKLKDAIARVAPIPSAVLIYGESGSGKELVARDVHRLSGQRSASRSSPSTAARSPRS